MPHGYSLCADLHTSRHTVEDHGWHIWVAVMKLDCRRVGKTLFTANSTATESQHQTARRTAVEAVLLNHELLEISAPVTTDLSVGNLT